MSCVAPSAGFEPLAPEAAKAAATASNPTVPRWLARPVLAFARAFNPWILRLAGRRGVPIAAVHHSGRRSGRHYATPVVAFPTRDGFIISLPYGSGTDWCRNVLVSSAASIRWQGVERTVLGPTVVGRPEASALLSARLRPLVCLAPLRQFLTLHRPRSGPVSQTHGSNGEP